MTDNEQTEMIKGIIQRLKSMLHEGIPAILEAAKEDEKSEASFSIGVRIHPTANRAKLKMSYSRKQVIEDEFEGRFDE